MVLYHECGRVCVVNSRALKIGKISKKTESPLGGEIEKNRDTSEPTGILREAATDLVWKTIPEPTEDEILESTSLASLNKLLQQELLLFTGLLPR